MFKVLTVADLKAFYKDESTFTGPIVIDRTTVKVCGDPLPQIRWEGKQRAVTKFWIDYRDGTYPIKAKDLTYDLDNDTDHGWIEKILNKGWVDMNNFSTAYFVALSMHGRQLSKEKVKKLKRHYTKQS